MSKDPLNEFHRLFAVYLDAKTKAYRAQVRAGHTLIELRRQIEADGTDWWKWFRENCSRSRRQAEKAIKIAIADGTGSLPLPRDRKDYMREYMRRKRAAAK